MPLCLVLNQNYETLTTTRDCRAVVLVQRSRAETLAHGETPIRTSSALIPRPAVIRLFEFIKRPRPTVRFTRRNIFERDGHVCGYCGKAARELTIDHVLPISRGGADTWVNVTTCCRACNHRKGARTPEEAHMTLRHKMVEPRVTHHVLGIAPLPEWLPFLTASI